MDIWQFSATGSSVHRWLPVDGGLCYLTRPDWKMPSQGSDLMLIQNFR
jgi:hypothetical protein